MINVADGANNYTHPHHSGDVVSVNDGATTIQPDAVTYAKMQNMSANRVLGRGDDGAGDVTEIAPGALRTLINVADGANNYSHPNHTGPVTSTGDGATAIADNAITEPMLSVTNTPGSSENNYVLSYNHGAVGGAFTWVENAGGGSGDITGVTLAGDSGTAEDLTANVDRPLPVETG